MISLVSDTETRPTPAMREAIASAEVGDEQRGEDPTVLLLQDRVADLLGKEAGLWLPTGTMCNVVATKVHTAPGDAIVADWMCHIVRAESGGVAFNAGVMVEAIRTERGIFGPSELDDALDRLTSVPPPYGQNARLVCVEQTHNFGGGAVWSLSALSAVCRVAHDRNIPVHMDGARLMNACISSGVPAAHFAAEVDSVWIDFTKGLGAPIGAVLAGTESFIRRARRYKHLFGGAMRQAGVAAAGCLFALDHHVERLAIDHDHAKQLAVALAQIDGISVRAPTETNMVFFDVARLGISNASFVERSAAAGVRMGLSGNFIRAVTHLDVSAEQIRRTVEVVRSIANAA
ncbi:MAG: threonine aldolase family protein [Myxococcota bacterium]